MQWIYFAISSSHDAGGCHGMEQGAKPPRFLTRRTRTVVVAGIARVVALLIHDLPLVRRQRAGLDGSAACRLGKRLFGRMAFAYLVGENLKFDQIKRQADKIGLPSYSES